MKTGWSKPATIEELAAIVLHDDPLLPRPQHVLDAMRAELNARVWARIAPIMEATPLPLARLCIIEQRKPS